MLHTTMKICRKHIVFAATMGAIVLLLIYMSSDAGSNTDQLSMVKDGTRNAQSLIESGRGTVTVHKWHDKSGGGVLETDSTYRIVFRGDKFRLSKTGKYVQNDPSDGDSPSNMVPVGSNMSYEASYDGTKYVVYYPGSKTAIVGDESTLDLRPIWRDYYENVAVIGNGIQSLANVDGKSGFSPLQLADNVTIDGRECAVAVTKQTIQPDDGNLHTLSYKYYVDINRGFAVPGFQLWVESSSPKQNVLVHERAVRMKEYGNDIWGPAKSTTTRYTLPTSGQGPAKKTMEVIAVFGDDFQINIPVDDEDLKLALPSGTSVRDKLLDTQYIQP